MTKIVSQWLALFSAILLLQIGNGLQSTVIGIASDRAGFATLAIGLVMSAFYAGYAAGSLAAPMLVERAGHVRAFVALAAIAAAAMGFYGVSVDPFTWALIRFAIGFSLSGIFVVAESWLNDQTGNETRGRVFAIYILVQLGGLMGGQMLVPVTGSAGALPIAVFAALVAASILPVALGTSPEANRHLPHPVGIAMLYRISPLAFVGVVVSGFIWAALMAMTPVYGERIGLTGMQTPLLVAMSIIGGVIFLVPMGWLSDHTDRRAVLIATAAGAAIAATFALFLDSTALTTLFIVVALYGGLTFPFYTLAVAHMNDKLLPEQRVPASAGLVLLFGLGSVFGPLVVSAAMWPFGPSGFFLVLALAAFSVAGFALWRMLARPGAQVTSQLYVPHAQASQLPPHPTP